MAHMLLVGIAAMVNCRTVRQSQATGEGQAGLGRGKCRRLLQEQGSLWLRDVGCLDDGRGVVEDGSVVLRGSGAGAGVAVLIGGQLLDGVLLALDHVLEAIYMVSV